MEMKIFFGGTMFGIPGVNVKACFISHICTRRFDGDPNLSIIEAPLAFKIEGRSRLLAGSQLESEWMTIDAMKNVWLLDTILLRGKDIDIELGDDLFLGKGQTSVTITVWENPETVKYQFKHNKFRFTGSFHMGPLELSGKIQILPPEYLALLENRFHPKNFFIGKGKRQNWRDYIR